MGEKMAGSHLSKEFFELIREIGECRSKQEEDRLMTAESVLLRQRMGEVPQKRPRELVVRLVYLELLGHDSGNSLNINVVNLANSRNIYDKRVGYLACSLLLNPDHELMLLLINTLLKDLQSANYLEVSSALITSTRLMSPDMVPILQPKILPLFSHAQETVRRQALLAYVRCVQLGGGETGSEDYQRILRKGLSDSDPSVMHVALTMLDELSETQLFETSQDLLPVLISILKSIQNHKLPKDFEYHRFPAPWTQTLLLRLMGRLCQQDRTLSEQCYEVLAETLRKTEAGVNIGHAVIYQTIECITMLSLEKRSPLLELCLNFIHKFLAANSHNNLRHAGVKLLGMLVAIDASLALDLQVAVVECLEDPDDTLRAETLGLLFNMANGNNAPIILDKLLNFLRTAPPHDDSHQLKLDLINKIFQLNEQFAASAEQFADNLINLLKLAGPLFPMPLFARVVAVVAEEQPIRQVLLARLEQQLCDQSCVNEPSLVALALALFTDHHPHPNTLSGDIFMHAEQITASSAESDPAGQVARNLFELKLRRNGAVALDEYLLSEDVELQTRATELKLTAGGDVDTPMNFVDLEQVSAILDQWVAVQAPRAPLPAAYGAVSLAQSDHPTGRLRYEAYEKPHIPSSVPPVPISSSSSQSLHSPSVHSASPTDTPQVSALSAAHQPPQPAVQLVKRWGPQGFNAAVTAPAPPAEVTVPTAVTLKVATSSESPASSASLQPQWQPRKTRADLEDEERKKTEEEDKRMKARQLFLGDTSALTSSTIPVASSLSHRWRDEDEDEDDHRPPTVRRAVGGYNKPTQAAPPAPSLLDRPRTPERQAVNLMDIDSSPKTGSGIQVNEAPRGGSQTDLLDVDFPMEQVSRPHVPDHVETPAKSDPLFDFLSDSSATPSMLQPLNLDVETVGSLWSTLPAEAGGELRVEGDDTFEDVLVKIAKTAGLHRVEVINGEAIMAGRETAHPDSKVFVHAAWRGSHVSLLVVSLSASTSQQVLQQLVRL